MTGFATAIEFRTDQSFASQAFASPTSITHRGAAPGACESVRVTNDPDRAALQRRLESGLDRLLRDIEKFEELERWDGLS